MMLAIWGKCLFQRFWCYFARIFCMCRGNRSWRVNFLEDSRKSTSVARFDRLRKDEKSLICICPLEVFEAAASCSGRLPRVAPRLLCLRLQANYNWPKLAHNLWPEQQGTGCGWPNNGDLRFESLPSPLILKTHDNFWEEIKTKAIIESKNYHWLDEL